ncbi:MAG: hypothetical protein ACJAUH_000707 [Saprospiraceae bacterium]|jgi:hypothetical protein
MNFSTGFLRVISESEIYMFNASQLEWLWLK